MQAKNIKTRLVSVSKNEGVAKNGKPYLFYTALFLDDAYKTVRLSLSNELVKDAKLVARLLEAKEVPANVELSIYQKGFDVKATVEHIEI